MSELEFKIRDKYTLELKDEWLYLTNLSETTIFQNYSWQLCWFENIHKKTNINSLVIISIYYQKKIIGIIPFEKKKYFNFNILTFTGIPFADYCDCLIDVGFFKSNYKIKNKIHKFLFNLEGIDLIMLDKINENSHLCVLFDKHYLKKQNYNSYQLIKEVDNSQLISKKFISDTNRQSKRLNLIGKLSHKLAVSISEKEKVLNFFFVNKKKQLISTNSWNYLDNETYSSFLRKLFISNDSHISYLSLDDKIIAVHLGYVKNKKLTYLFPAYDREYSNFSPGNILLLEMINIFFNNHGNEFDFTTGNEPYKLRLANTKQEIFYKNISLNIKGNFLRIILEFSNYIKKIKVLRLFIQKIRY